MVCPTRRIWRDVPKTDHVQLDDCGTPQRIDNSLDHPSGCGVAWIVSIGVQGCKCGADAMSCVACGNYSWSSTFAISPQAGGLRSCRILAVERAKISWMESVVQGRDLTAVFRLDMHDQDSTLSLSAQVARVRILQYLAWRGMQSERYCMQSQPQIHISIEGSHDSTEAYRGLFLRTWNTKRSLVWIWVDGTTQHCPRPAYVQVFYGTYLRVTAPKRQVLRTEPLAYRKADG
nr:hypothetical protein CFP56_13013 [Quercus suber]